MKSFIKKIYLNNSVNLLTKNNLLFSIQSKKFNLLIGIK